MWQLVINGPGYFDTTYDLPDGAVHMGRADENEIVLSGDLVSRRHARLAVDGDTLSFEDLGSRNGSKVNGVSTIGAVPVLSGDILTVGENTLAVRKPWAAENASTELIDTSKGGVRRFGKGSDIMQAVVLAKDIRDSVVMRVLDNFAPFDLTDAPVPGVRVGAGDTDEDEVKTSEVQLGSDASPVAWQSLALLYRVAERLAAAPDLQGFLEDTTDLVMKRVGATTGVVLLRHPSGVLVPSAVRHSRKLSRGEVPVSDAIVEAALSQGQAIAVADVRDDSRFNDRESVVLYGVDQVLCVPIGTRAPFYGVLYLNRSSVTDEPLEALLDICSAITQLLLTAVQKFQGKPQQDDRLRRTLERFHAPDIVEQRVAELQEAGVKLTRLEEKQVTVLFADISGFTDLARVIGPERAVDILNNFYTLTTQLIFSFEGTVDKFLGDAVMAVFGAPYGKGDDAIRAVRTGLAIRVAWDKEMERRPPRERLKLKVGLNTGKVLAGTVGTSARLDYTVVGEPVNIASWLCATAEAGQVLITGKTLAAVGARFDVTPLGEKQLRGARARTAVFEVLEEDNEAGTLSGIK